MQDTVGLPAVQAVGEYHQRYSDITQQQQQVNSGAVQQQHHWHREPRKVAYRVIYKHY